MTWRCGSAAVSVWVDKIMCCWGRPEFAVQQNDHICVMIKFGVVQAVRMLDEGIVQSSLYCDKEIQKYKETGFQNVIYEVQDV